MAESADNNTYKDSLKATGLFGGVQVINIFVQIAKSKVAAILLGPVGVGVYGLYTQAKDMLIKGTSFGLSSSAVRNISEANGSCNEDRVRTITSVFRRLVWLTGSLGLLVCLLSSPLLSKVTFGNYDYTIGFAVLSLSLLFDQLASGQTTILQGLRRYSFMAKSNVIGNVIGLLVTIPLYYIWHVDAIVPVIVLSSVTSLALSWFFYRKLHLVPKKVDSATVFKEGKGMLIMGLSISVSGLVETLIAYYLRIYIGRQGGFDEVGLFTAGFAIVNTYVGLILNSMGTDYYPRLSEVNQDTIRFNRTINNQLEIVLLLLAPIITFFIVLIDLIIIVLYSDKFVNAEGLICWAIYGCYFKAFSWCISYGFLAKGDYKAFIANELGCKIYTFPSQLIGYNIAGLTGIGLAYLINFILYSIQVYIICHKRYSLDLQKSTVILFVGQLPLLTGCLLTTLFASGWRRYLIGLPFIVASLIISYRELKKRVDIIGLLKSKIQAKKTVKSK